MTSPRHLKFRRRRQQRRRRRILLVLLAALVLTGVLYLTVRVFDPAPVGPASTPATVENPAVQF